jgi:ATP-binding cassette subfamily C protein CydC
VTPLRRLIALARSERRWLVIGGLAAFGALAAQIGLMTTAPYLISRATLVVGFAALSLAVTAVRAFALSRAAFRYLERYTTHLSALRILTRIRVAVYQGIERISPGGLGLRSGDLLARVDADVGSLDDFFVRGLVPTAAALMAAGVACAVLAWLDGRLALVLAVFLVGAGLALPLGARAASRGPAARLVAARGRLHADVTEQIMGIGDLVAFGQEESALDRVGVASGSIARLQVRLGSIRGAASGVGALISGLGGVVCLWLAVPLVRTGDIPGVFLATVPLVAFAAFEGVLPLGDAYRQTEVSRAAATRTFELMDTPPTVEEPDHPLPAPQLSDIWVEHISFRYPDTDREVLRDLTFALPRKGRLGIVGRTGVGKTTIVNLLLRFWSPTMGRIFLGPDDVTRFRTDDVRALIGVVPQHPYLFNGTLRDNLMLADGTADDGQLLGACERAQLGRFVESLPAGLSTTVGENGLKLSGGERQRVAVARLFLREAPVAILDEPTANLDDATERAVVQELERFAADRTLLLISHRPAALRLVETVLELRPNVDGLPSTSRSSRFR